MAPTLQDATNALQQGNEQLATGTLATLVRSEPNNETAWLMLASVLDDNDRKRHCLERVLAINPANV
jgi:Tfp pilus assembly protein PilF